MRRLAILLSAAACMLLLLFGFGSVTAHADEDDEDLRIWGSLETPAGEPIEEAELTVADADGETVEAVETDDSGDWEVFVSESGEYSVELDESTLPENLLVESGDPRRSVEVLGRDQRIVFTLDTEVVEEDEQTADGDDADSDEEVFEDDDAAEFGGGFLPRFYSGIHLGLMIALAGLGLSLIFGTSGVTNFAHGELVSFGAVVVVALNVPAIWGLDIPVLPAAAIAIVAGMALGYFIDLGLWRPLRKRKVGLVTMMIISIGLALMLRHTYEYLVGSDLMKYRQYGVQESISVGPLLIPPKVLVSDILAVVVIGAVIAALVFTRWGKATRAVADNPSLAEASGINADRTVRMVWAVGAGLAALAGVLVAVKDGAKFDMGWHMLLFIFAAVVVGGLGTAFGAVLGGLLVGVLIQVSTMVIPNEFKYVVALAVLIVVLLVRPQGILGRRERVG